MGKRKISYTQTASSILEKRNKAFRVLYNTVIEVTQSQDDKIFTILAHNLREMTQATTAALAVVDLNSMSLILKAVNHNGEDLVIDENAPGNITPLTPEIIEFFGKSIIHEIQENEINLVTLFPKSSLSHLVPSSDSVLYNITCLRNQDIFALGLLHFNDNHKLKMKDMADTYLGLSSVIIQRAKAIRELHISKQWFQNLLNCSPVGIIVVNHNREVVEINDSALDLLSCERAVITGKSCKDFFCSNDGCPIFDDGKTINQNEIMIEYGDNQTIPILKSALPIEIDKKQYIIETIVDVSELKKSQEQRLQLEKELIRHGNLNL